MPNSSETLYGIAKANIYDSLSNLEELPNDFYIEESIQNEIQKLHLQELHSNENKWFIERNDIMMELNKAKNELKNLKEKVRKEQVIPKTK